MELTGTFENVEIAQWVHDWLLSTSESLWRDHRKHNKLKGNAARRNFLQGVMMGFGEKLSQETIECEQTGLVWAGDPALDQFIAHRYQRVRSGRRMTVRTDSAWQDGRTAGRALTLRKPVTQTSRRRGRRIDST